MTYHDLVNVDDFEKKEYFNQERWDVAFYCKDCKKIVETERPNPDGYTFLCKKCDGKNIVIGTQEWLKTNYRLN
jgi:Zn finger protein HypA/HybF involved in hydrogenase expression